jgi:hypothetical protein
MSTAEILAELAKLRDEAEALAVRARVIASMLIEQERRRENERNKENPCIP